MRPLALLLLMCFAAGCTALTPRRVVPADQIGDATVNGFEGVRYWGDEFSDTFQHTVIEAIRARKADLRSRNLPYAADVLAISGGGANGAFGAGFLVGWTQRGDRPEFTVVTGISTGALIAPFAFLGREFDDVLIDSYTNVTPEDIFFLRNLFDLFRGESIADVAPLRKRLDRLIDGGFVAAVAREHARGRRLYIGTTNLDAQRPVVWDMGAIATVGGPASVRLFKQVMLASAAIPGVFPPVHIDVSTDCGEYEEMHVDGGVTKQLFHFGYIMDYRAAAREAADVQGARPTRLFVLRNGLLRPEPAAVERRIVPIASRSISTLIKAQALGDLHRLYLTTRRDGVEFLLCNIPADFQPDPEAHEFDRLEMNRLFNIGYNLGKSDYQWHNRPPGFDHDSRVP